jgi:hypothetical protein
MPTVTVPFTSVHDVDGAAAARRPSRQPRPAVDEGSTAARVFLARYGSMLVSLLAAVTGLELAWPLYAADAWPAAIAVVAGWALALAAWLHRRGWPAGTARSVLAAPAVTPAALGVLGCLSPAWLALWGPVSTVLAVALAMAAQPPAPERPPPPRPHPRLTEPPRSTP